jgi:hypothetical protein
VIPLHPQRPPHKMLSRGGSFGEATADPQRILAWLVRNLERLVEELEFYQVRTDRLDIYVGYRSELGNRESGIGKTKTGPGFPRLPTPESRIPNRVRPAGPICRRRPTALIYSWRRGSGRCGRRGSPACGRSGCT